MLLNNRLSSEEKKLIRRIMTLLDMDSCVGGCGVDEIFNNLFTGCDFSQSFWNKIFHWLGVHGLLNVFEITLYNFVMFMFLVKVRVGPDSLKAQQQKLEIN
jgi:hypothetical protein